jgi:hypothetical protein
VKSQRDSGEVAPAFLCLLAYLNGLSPESKTLLESLLDKPRTGKLPRGLQPHSKASVHAPKRFR